MLSWTSMTKGRRVSIPQYSFCDPISRSFEALAHSPPLQSSDSRLPSRWRRVGAPGVRVGRWAVVAVV
jgi:hypothetical protein